MTNATHPPQWLLDAMSEGTTRFSPDPVESELSLSDLLRFAIYDLFLHGSFELTKQYRSKTDIFDDMVLKLAISALKAGELNESFGIPKIQFYRNVNEKYFSSKDKVNAWISHGGYMGLPDEEKIIS